MSKSLLGELSTVLAIASIAAPALSVGLHLYLANRLASDGSRRAGIEGKVGLTATLALYSIAALSSAASVATPSSGLFWPISALAFANSAFLLTSGTIRGLDMPFLFSALTLIVQVGGLVVLGVVTGATRAVAPGIVCYVGVVGTGVVAQYFLLWKQSRSCPWRGWLQLISTAGRLVPHLVAAVALLMIMRILVGLVSGRESLASYQYASLLIGGVITVAASLDAHWSVRAQHADSIQSLRRILERNQFRIQLVLFVATASILSFCALALRIWLPSGYDPRPIALTVIFAVPAGALQAYADGRSALAMWSSRNGIVSASTATGVVSASVAAVVLIPYFGWPVVGLAVTVGALTRALLICFGTRLLAGSLLFSWRSTLPLGIQFLMMSSALFIFHQEGQ